jgi:hypothetical protein
MLGRILAVELALGMIAESVSTIGTGYLLEYHSAETTSLCLAGIGFVVTAGWTLYHVTGHGVARMSSSIGGGSSSSNHDDTEELERATSATVPLLRETRGVHHRALRNEQ